MPSTQSRSFDCARAAELLGHPAATVKSCDSLLPDLWRVVLVGGDFAAGHHEVIPLVWEDGAIVKDRGMAALAHYLQRIQVYELDEPNVFGFIVLLDHLQATPPGFRGEGLEAHYQPTGDRGGITLRPFALTLLAVGYQPPAAAPADSSGGPPLPTNAPPGPTGAPAPAPGAGPGVTPPRLGRATLRGDDRYRFTWTIEVRDSPQAAWTVIETTPLR